jgi:hypothetical protein
MRSMGTSSAAGRSANNLSGLDYRTEALRMGPPVVPIIDAHAHVAGGRAAQVYDEARQMYGVRLTYSMTPLPMVPAVRDVLGDSIRFIAFPTWSDPDRNRAHRAGFLEVIEAFHRDHGSRILKLWASPRLRDVIPDGGTDVAQVDSPWRRRACDLGRELGMMFMVHVADPDTWFKTSYKDAARYGSKADQYVGLERMLDEYEGPWIAAHMGGWPENLPFLDGLLSRHPNLNLDTSATKWVVRELGRQEPERVRSFIAKWRGRLLFGSDIVTTDDHLQARKERPDHPKADQARSPEQALELYASRYWALRTMFETRFDGPSPVADPDLKMIEPDKYDEMSSPRLRGLALPASELRVLYAEAAQNLLGR